MSDEWKSEKDPNEWKRQGMDEEGEIRSVMDEMEQFEMQTEFSKDELEQMLFSIFRWRRKYAAGPDSRLKEEFKIAVMRCETTIAAFYLDKFLEIDEPDKPSWDVMDYLLKVLNKGKNMELLWKGETPEEQEKIRGHVLNMISATYLKPRPEDEK